MIRDKIEELLYELLSNLADGHFQVMKDEAKYIAKRDTPTILQAIRDEIPKPVSVYTDGTYSEGFYDCICQIKDLLK